MSLSDRAYSEKRNFRRMKIDSPVMIETHNGRQLQGVCKDLSGAGMLLEVQQQFPVGTELSVTIKPDKSNQAIFSASAEVARVKPTSAGKFTLGLMIRQIHN